MSEVETKVRLIESFAAEPWRAHDVFFRHRHPDESPPAHRDLVAAIYSSAPRQLIEGFRGLAKSTYLEEGAVIKAAYGRVGIGGPPIHNMVIVGSSYARAVDRLASVKRELEMNELLAEVFGALKGPVWQEGKIVLSNGICIQALGRDQSMLGIKHLDWRPDAALIDDVEDPEEVRTDAEREQTWSWFLKTFLPSLDHPLSSWVRVLGTRRGSGSLPERLEKDRWPTLKIPVEYKDDAGARRASWPAKFPLHVIDRMKDTYRGDMHTWAQEYMCVAMSETDRVFRREMFRVEPRVKTWQATYAMIDPARTARRTSATTGWAVWSWVRNRLVVWAADAPRLLPDEIVALAFDLAERFDPIWIGVEQDGLEEFLLQPLRHEQVKRGVMIPYRGMRAPRGKLDFIRGLQPFAAAGEIQLAQDMPALVDQFVSFPTGDIDAPNALAYSMLMRPGLPIYDNFAAEHVVEEPDYDRHRPVYLVANATGSMVAAALVQHGDGRLVVLADWMREGMPAEVTPQIYSEAATLADTARMTRADRHGSWSDMLKNAVPDHLILRRTPPTWVIPPKHAERYMNAGLAPAARGIPSEVRYGGVEAAGQRRLHELLDQRPRGDVAVQVAAAATWTLRALAGGYTKAFVKGRIQDEAEAGPYRLLMEGIESFVGISRGALASREEDDDTENYAFDRHGRRYRSAMPARG